MKFYAHSTTRTDKADWQTLASHLTSVGKLASEKAEAFGGQQCALIAGLLHDLGKYTVEFQNRLEGSGHKVDHSTWGARIAIDRYGPLGKMLAYGIAGHHAGLANGRDSEQRRSLADRLKCDLPELCDHWESEICLPSSDAVKPPIDFQPNKYRGQFQLAFLARMIFSCLVDADFLDTERFYQKIEGTDSARDNSWPGLEELLDQLNRYLKNFEGTTEVNRIRAEILSSVRSRSSKVPGLFSLTVPTGGGKTLASLAFALDHAITHGLRRIIYVIPFTSIVEQTAAVFREAFAHLGGQAVLEHHSNFIDDKNQAPESRDKLKLAMENWDAPVVVTTAVQFFESLFADRPSRCRKLHNIAGSVVILDEAQILPLKLLRPCVAAIDELARNYRVSIVLCTATQPALKAPDFVGGLENVRELAPEPARLYRILERVRVRHLGPTDDNALVERIAGRAQVLCIVNNRRHARTLFERIVDLSGAFHLSTLMCAKHRSQRLVDIRRQLKDGQPCRLIATSLIEAGVDIDFPTVLRAEAGLDSIAQAAGRCNREGKRTVESSEVLIFAPDNDLWSPPPELKQFAQAAREIWRQFPDEPMSLEAVDRYFKHLYWQKGSQELDAHDLLTRFEDGRLDGLPFETTAAKFRMIESVQYPVIIPFDNAARSAIKALSSTDHASGVARCLQPYVVQLPRRGYEAMRKAGAIEPVAQHKFGEQFMVLINESLYDERFGLDWDNPIFIDAERLVL